MPWKNEPTKNIEKDSKKSPAIQKIHPKKPPPTPYRKLIFLLKDWVKYAWNGADTMLPAIIIVIGKVEKHLFSANICPARPDITKYNPS